jgi:hypothetical protein
VTQRDISGSVEVTVRDIESVMENVDEGSLNLYFDGTNLKPGIANTPVVKVEMEGTVRSIDFDADQVRIPVRLKELLNDGTTTNDNMDEATSETDDTSGLQGSENSSETEDELLKE